LRNSYAGYRVNVDNENGCTGTSASVTVAISSLPELSIHDAVICSGDNFTVTAATANNSDTLYWYSDALYSQLIIKASSFTVHSLTNDTTFYVRAVDVHGCASQDSLGITVVPPPQVSAMSDRRICYGDEITLTADYSADAVSWNVPHTSLRPAVTADYIVTASRPPCTDARDTVRITVGDSLYILPHTLPAFRRNSFYEQQLQTNAEAPQFSVALGELPKGILLHSDGLISGISTLGTQEESNYAFIVQLLDSYGCSVYKTYSLDGGFYVPLVFSPNDDGVNDHFMTGYKVIIFDRLGVKIFEGDDGWDGKSNNRQVPDDTYYYILFYSDTKGQERQHAGSITIVR